MRKMVALVAMVLATGACSADTVAENLVEQAIENQDGAGDVNIDIDSDDGSVEFSVEGEDGEGSVTVGGGELPDNMPFSVPDGGEVQAVSTSNDGSLVSVLYPASDYDSLVDHFRGIYDSDDGTGKAETSIESPPSQSWSWNTTSGGFRSLTVQVQGDRAMVTIIYGDS